MIANLDELRKELDQIRANQQRTRVELELIKFKVTLAGLIAGFVASAAITVLKSIMN